ncbi:NAD(P)-dependent oxidoreductase [Maridesulfovibrio sp.]|uniref:NAD-dependent epimerase/dehydratase family protein n=1 Tax=Maridesulfovibrio sp. TaxID=2795000 RepID=UPI0029F4BC5A|nr:NAD(P)-dependent oxidoreductase [Maridesulfovibrio sp.]
MRILVTGASGFIGNYVVREIIAQGHEVIATTRNIENLSQRDWVADVSCKKLDLVDLPEGIFSYLGSPERIIHLAWGGLPNYNDSIHTGQIFRENFEFCKKMVEQGAKHLLVAGTCFEYGLTEGSLPVSTPPAPVTEYGRGKNMLREALEGIFKDKAVLFQWARLFYIYGEGQSPNSLYSQVRKAVADGDKVFNMSKGDQVRDFLSVEQVAKKIVTLALHSEESGIFNICSGKPRTVLSLVEEFFAAHDHEIELNKGYYPYPTYEPFAFWGQD